MKRELGLNNVRVIATGGMAHMVAQASDVIDEIDRMLTIKGLRMIYEKNRAE
jgi:type III pantothenate kinase